MPFHCPVCNSVDYDEADGHYFCQECGLQSQEIHVQEADPETFNATFSQRAEVKSEKKKLNGSDKMSNNGRPWTIYEGFQYILMAQAEALVDLGADISFPQTVFIIWANYLSHLGVAFCKKEKVVPDVVMKYGIGRLRELHRGSFDNPLNHKSAWTERRGQKRQIEETELNLLEGDSEDEADFVEKGFIDENEDRIDMIQHGNIKKMVSKNPEYMTMPKTLALCYIGLMISNPTILPCDLIRWVYEGRIPYLSASHVIPDDMVFSDQDVHTFNGEINSDELLLTINKLLKFFRLAKLPDIHVNIFIDRFVQELHLPDDLKMICYNLVAKIDLQFMRQKSENWRKEKLAMAYIILALRLVYGVDGIKEIHLSDTSRTIQELITSDLKVFIWEDWRRFWHKKHYIQFSPFTEIHKDISSTRLTHLDELLKWFSSLKRENKKITHRKSKWSDKGACRRSMPEFYTDLQKPIEQAIKKLENRQNDDKKETLRKHINDTIEGFRKSTLGHIINLPEFRKTIQLKEPKNKELHNLVSSLHHTDTQLLTLQPIRLDKHLPESRPPSYLWLLQLCNQLILPQSTAVRDNLSKLDIVVIRLQNTLLDLCKTNEKKNVIN